MREAAANGAFGARREHRFGASPFEMVPTRVNLGARLRSARAKHVTNRRQSVGASSKTGEDDVGVTAAALPIERVRMAVYGVDDFS